VIVYLDTSAMLKLYVNEPGARQVRAAVATASGVYSHLIAYAEMCAAFSKAARMGRISAAALKRHRRELDNDWRQYNVLTPDERMIRRAGDLIDRFGLRGYDGVHLAAAESLQVTRDKGFLCFACFDDTLNDSTAALGLGLLQREK
jgi:uncharacterized protein